MFEEQYNEACSFIKEVGQELGNPKDKKTALRITASLFHTVRDMLTIEESLHLISQMPLYLKGVYVDGWHNGKTDKVKDLDDFVERLLIQNPSTGPHDFGDNEKAIRHARAVFKVLSRHISDGEINDIKAQFPGSLKHLWEEDPIINSR